MGMDICTFVKDIDDSITMPLLDRMKQMGMDCAISPNFSFKTSHGFVSFKLQLTQSEKPLLSQQAYLAGFEYAIQPFDLSARISEFQPKQSFWERLLGKKQPPVTYVNDLIDKKLQDCHYCLSFSWGNANTLEFRMATVVAAVIAELCQGICCLPADNIWYDNQFLVEDFVKAANDYEASLTLDDIKLYPFSHFY